MTTSTERHEFLDETMTTDEILIELLVCNGHERTEAEGIIAGLEKRRDDMMIPRHALNQMVDTLKAIALALERYDHLRDGEVERMTSSGLKVLGRLFNRDPHYIIADLEPGMWDEALATVGMVASWLALMKHAR